jgi:hypothetical protein
MTTILTQGDIGHTSLSIRPFQVGTFNSMPLGPSGANYNSDIPALAYRATTFSWAVCGFNSGHFASTVEKWNLPFQVVLACDPFEYGCALFHEFVCCPTVLHSATSLLDHIRGSGDQGHIHGYLIHSHRYQSSEPTSIFWGLQASIVQQLQLIRHLRLFVAFVHLDHDSRSVSKFISNLTSCGWVLSTTKCTFPDLGDSVVGILSIIVGIHDSTQSKVAPLEFRFPPSPKPLPLAAYIWTPFDKRDFAADIGTGLVATTPSESVLASHHKKSKPMYYLHAGGADATVLAGAAVFPLDSLCPPFDESPNSNIFCDWFGVELHADGHTHVRGGTDKNVIFLNGPKIYSE